MLALCFLLACLGTAPDPETRVAVGHELTHKNGATEDVVFVESGWLISGFVHQARPAVFAGGLPLQVRLWRFDFDGGVAIYTARVPAPGTYLNFIARASFPLTSRLSVTWFHISNGGIGRRNPATDAIGLSVRMGKL